MRGKNHAVTSVILPVTGMNQPYTDGNGRDFGKRQVIIAVTAVVATRQSSMPKASNAPLPKIGG